MQPWIWAALLAGVAYLVIGRLFALPVDNAHAWRLAAWLVSGVVFAAHIGYEHIRLRSPALTTATHAATGVALGGFGLAVAGALHSLNATSTIRPAWLLALVAWPLITAIPGFLVALGIASLLNRFRQARYSE